LAAAAVLAVVAVGAWQLSAARAARDAIAGEVLASHVRSLLGEHLTDVASTDQHTVKPWFNGRLDFSPPVSDFAGAGFPLLGGRIDYVGGRAVAALVYGRRRHVINVYLWPAERGATAGPAALTRQGYHLRHWTTPVFVYWIASDLGTAELDQFAGLLRSADAATP
jgi:anti-sigma factor RsiW